MLPVVAGRAVTTRQILIYSVLLVPISVLPSVLGFAGVVYGGTAVLCGAIFVALAWGLHHTTASDRPAATRLFAFSIFYLFTLIAALLAGGGNRIPEQLSSRTASMTAAAEFLPHIAQAAVHPAGNLINISAEEV